MNNMQHQNIPLRMFLQTGLGILLNSQRYTRGLCLNYLPPLGLAATTVLSLVKTSIWIEEDLSERDRDLRSVMTNKGKGWEQLELFIRVMVIRLTSRTYKLSYRSFTNFESSFLTSGGAQHTTYYWYSKTFQNLN